VFSVFLHFGKPLHGVPVVFGVVILFSGLFGYIVARLYSEPMNRLLRRRLGDGANRLGSVVDGSYAVEPTDLLMR
jgi:hypothetical protein